MKSEQNRHQSTGILATRTATSQRWVAGSLRDDHPEGASLPPLGDHLACGTQELPRQFTRFAVPNPHRFTGKLEPVGKFFIRKVANFDACRFERLAYTGLNFNLRILKVGIGS